MSNPVDNWEIKDNKLYRKYEFKSFMDAINFINQVAEISDAMDHHAVITNVYNTVEFELWSHDQNSITDSCLLYTSPSPRDRQKSRMPSSA